MAAKVTLIVKQGPQMTMYRHILGAMIRTTLGVYWIYFSSQRWLDYSWAKDLLIDAAKANTLPIYGEILRSMAVPNWEIVIVTQTVLEAIVGFLLLLGLLTRLSAIVGVVLAVNLTLTFTPSASDFGLVFWFYLLSVVANASVITDESNRWIGLDRFLTKKPR